MGFIDPYIGTEDERERLYQCFYKSLDAKLKKLDLVYGIYGKNEIVTVKWLDMIQQTTGNEGNDGTGCWGNPDPKLNIEFKHELTSPFIGWKAEEFRAFEALCLEKIGSRKDL